MAVKINRKSFLGIREMIFIGSLLLAVFLSISLFSFNAEDGGWSHSGLSPVVHNGAGRLGAQIADCLLNFFGIEAYLFPLLLIWRNYDCYRNSRLVLSNGYLLLRWLGFCITLIAGTVMFYLRVPRFIISLANGSGGILGQEVGDQLLFWLSEYHALLLSASIFLIGLASFTQFSWLTVFEWFGKWTIRYAQKISQQIVHLFHSTVPAATTTVTTKSSAPIVTGKPSIKPTFIKSKIFQTTAKKSSSRSQTTVKPELSLLEKRSPVASGYSAHDLSDLAQLVEKLLADFNVSVSVVAICPGPVITRFELQPAPGVKISRISGLTKDLARGLSVTRVRIVEVIQGKSVIGLEIPNREREMVSLYDLLASTQFTQAHSVLTLALGKDISGIPVMADLAKMPHVLVAGTTGSGKSVALNTMILSLLYKATPEQVRMIMIDPKMLELSVYEGIPHLLTSVVTDMNEASNALKWAVGEMERRYQLMSKLGVRNVAGFNHLLHQANAEDRPITNPIINDGSPLQPLSHIVIIIDELADLMMVVGKKVEELIARLAQKARAAGIHLILATQRPSVDVLTGLIKANIPTRISFQVSSKIDSRTILDQSGAESLLGNGDMLFLPAGSSVPIRAHGAFVDDEEVHRVVHFLKNTMPADYLTEIVQSTPEPNSIEDVIYRQAVAFVLETGKVSTSHIQRQFKIGYNRAARLVEEMEAQGLISAAQQNGNRSILVNSVIESK